MVHSPNIWNAKILIVDDEQANALLLERILSDAGYRAITCTLNSSAVCGLHLEHHFDLILLDLQMPGMNGFQVMEELKLLKLDDYLPVMVLTAHSAHKLKALKCGAKDFISKPFDLNEVLLRVHNMLEVRLLHLETQERGKRLESLVHYDPLTGLGNRRLLAERMSMAMAHARRKKRSMAVIYLDLDGFKQINDTLGHGVGDLLLVAVSDRLSSLVREEDTLVRLGGDEFLVLLTDLELSAPEHGVTVVAQKVIQAIGRPFEIEPHAIHITTSAGIGIYPGHGEDPDTLIERADRALYEAKHAGKNIFRISQALLTPPLSPSAPFSGSVDRLDSNIESV